MKQLGNHSGSTAHATGKGKVGAIGKFSKTLIIGTLSLIMILPLTAMGQPSVVKKVAIMEVVDKNKEFSYDLKLMLRSQLTEVITNTPGYEALDRVDLLPINDEQEFQRTGMVSDDQIKRVGEMTGADYLLVLEVIKRGYFQIFVSAKILEVETARVMRSASIITRKSDEEFRTNSRKLAQQLLEAPRTTATKTNVLDMGDRRYIGQLKNGKPHGSGTMYYSIDDPEHRRSYDGAWVDGEREGEGTMVWNDGERYAGSWKNGLRHGKGTTYFSPNDEAERRTYEGEWINDVRQGFGTMVWNHGETYVGSWKNGQRYGHGVEYFGNGDRYDGDWKNGERDGLGTYYWSDGRKFTGQWKNNQQNGEGTHYWPNGDWETCDYQNGAKNGPANYRFATGESMKGEYKDGKAEGKWIKYGEDGKRIETVRYKNGVRKRFTIF